MTVVWDDELEALFAADLTVALGYRTPAGGVIVPAVAPIGLHDRERGTLGFTTSLGFSKKLERPPVVVLVALVTEDAATGFLLSAGAQLIGLNTRQHTGWLKVGDSGAVYAPHTETGYRTPASKTVQLLINGALAKQGVRASRTTNR